MSGGSGRLNADGESVVDQFALAKVLLSLIRECIEKDAVPVGIADRRVPRPIRMGKGGLLEIQAPGSRLFVNRFDVAPAKVDEILRDVSLLEGERHIVVSQNAPVLRSVVFDDLEVELQIELDRASEIFDVEAKCFAFQDRGHAEILVEIRLQAIIDRKLIPGVPSAK